MQVDPVAVGKHHKPAVAPFRVALRAVLGVLHEQNISEAFYPFAVRTEGGGFTYDEFDIIIAQKVFFRTGIDP